MTQERMAAMLDVHRITLVRWENGWPLLRKHVRQLRRLETLKEVERRANAS